MRRVCLLLVIAVAASCGTAHATASTPTKAAAHAAAKHKKKNKRRGGHVRKAWPRNKKLHAPKNRLARWLAKQVGPVKVKHRNHKHLSQTGAGSGTTTTLSSGSAGTLWLVRSFEIPKSDGAYDRLANYSWTYDNALATFGFISFGLKAGAEQLLDQLKALQRADGSLEYAFDTRTGASAPVVRAGALAWVAEAATAYRRKYDSDRYDALIAGALKYLLSLRNSAGLVKGGPDVTWVSTQHNLLVVGLLRDLADQMSSKETIGGYTKAQLDAIQKSMGDALLASTLVTDSATTAYFKQGIDDGQMPVDVQALGAMYLKVRGDARASKVANTLTARFLVSGRGYRPFFGTGAPDVAWSEGTLEASVALDRLDVSSPATDAAVLGIAGTVKGSTTGPIGADRDVVSPVWGEYHTWPASAAASWLLIRAAPTQYLLSR